MRTFRAEEVASRHRRGTCDGGKVVSTGEAGRPAPRARRRSSAGDRVRLRRRVGRSLRTRLPDLLSGVLDRADHHLDAYALRVINDHARLEAHVHAADAGQASAALTAVMQPRMSSPRPQLCDSPSGLLELVPSRSRRSRPSERDIAAGEHLVERHWIHQLPRSPRDRRHGRSGRSLREPPIGTMSVALSPGQSSTVTCVGGSVVTIAAQRRSESTRNLGSHPAGACCAQGTRDVTVRPR